MKNALKLIYRLLIPSLLQHRITGFLAQQRMSKLSNKILSYYSQIPTKQISEEENEVLEFIKNNPAYIFPYRDMNNTSYKEVQVLHDKHFGLNYVLMDGKKLFFRKDWSIRKIQDMYKGLSAEQIYDSPHRYLVKGFDIEDGDVVVDSGAAEGNFALSIVEKASHIYLFEADPEWVKPLEATFAPWSSKVHIINKYLTHHNDNQNTTLDEFFGSNQKIDFVKVDVEGAESDLLEGCKRILSSNSPLKIALCTYHKEHDEKIFTALLKSYGFDVEHSKRFMIYHWDKALKAPYLRRGLLRAIRI